MKDVYQVLRQKEMDLARVRREVEELRSILPWLSDHLAEPPEASGESSLMSGGTNKWFLEPDEGGLTAFLC